MLRYLTTRGIQIFLLLLLLAAASFYVRESPTGVVRIRQFTFDTYNRLFPRAASNDTAIVDVDEESLRRLGQWPWPRSVVGDIPVILRELGAKSVTFDIVFSEPDRTSPSAIAKNLPDTPAMAPVIATLEKLPDNDRIFAEKIAKAGNVVMGFAGTRQFTGREALQKASFLDQGVNPDPEKFATTVDNFTAPLPELAEAAAGGGCFNMLPGDDGVVRRVPLLVGKVDAKTGKIATLYPSLSLEAIRTAFDASIYKIVSYGERVPEGYGIESVGVARLTVPTDEQGRMLVYFAGHEQMKGNYIPAWKLLAHKVDAARVKDKIVFVGTSATGLLDLRSSPLDPVLPGVEVHAELVQQMLNGQFLRRTDFMTNMELVASALLSLCIIFIAPFVSAWALALVTLLAMGGSCALGAWAYRNTGYLIDPLCPSIVVTVIFMVSSILTNLRTELEKRMIRMAFGQYISPVLIEELAKDPDKLKLGGDVRELTVMFTDIRNFTTISETMDPAELIRMMNDFLTPMTSAVLENRGTVDKYMGDAMMTFWNAPVDDAYHAQNACKAALEMVEALKPVNAELKLRAEKAGRPFHELKAGIGVNSGKASVGNMGSKQRFAYSALGDTVNLASRLEGQTKQYGVTTLISASTHRQVADFACLELDLLTVKGRTEPERIYTLLGSAETAATADFRAFAEKHGRMLAAYRAQRWDEAEKLAAECAAARADLSGLYALYEGRIAAYRAQPPGPEWAGVWIAKEK